MRPTDRVLGAGRSRAGMGTPSAHTSRGHARLHAVASARERTFVDLASTGGVLRDAWVLHQTAYAAG